MSVANVLVTNEVSKQLFWFILSTFPMIGINIWIGAGGEGGIGPSVGILDAQNNLIEDAQGNFILDAQGN